MADETISLELISRQYQRVLDEIGGLREDMHVLTAIVLRHDREFEWQAREFEHMNERLAEMLNQMRAMVTQHQRFDGRLRKLEAGDLGAAQ